MVEEARRRARTRKWLAVIPSLLVVAAIALWLLLDPLGDNWQDELGDKLKQEYDFIDAVVVELRDSGVWLMLYCEDAPTPEQTDPVARRLEDELNVDGTPIYADDYARKGMSGNSLNLHFCFYSGTDCVISYDSTYDVDNIAFEQGIPSFNRIWHRTYKSETAEFNINEE